MFCVYYYGNGFQFAGIVDLLEPFWLFDWTSCSSGMYYSGNVGFVCPHGEVYYRQKVWNCFRKKVFNSFAFCFLGINNHWHSICL